MALACAGPTWSPHIHSFHVSLVGSSQMRLLSTLPWPVTNLRSPCKPAWAVVPQKQAYIPPRESTPNFNSFALWWVLWRILNWPIPALTLADNYMYSVFPV